MSRVYIITKYPAEKTRVKIGQVWMVQIEPIVLGQQPRKLEVVEVTKTTVKFSEVSTNRSFPMTFRYLHSSVLFLEEVTDEA